MSTNRAADVSDCRGRDDDDDGLPSLLLLLPNRIMLHCHWWCGGRRGQIVQLSPDGDNTLTSGNTNLTVQEYLVLESFLFQKFLFVITDPLIS
ncbi:unnamed protein product [Ceratitis capitata]|uniref:(Mediterranean fruit fly) hypothetical protein n=1 Tax=Ceratitis capitata TaxID=7213 RepID=A0A811VJ36_CERCA|nr:unnamed protein product [Ceratitis capitata]